MSVFENARQAFIPITLMMTTSIPIGFGENVLTPQYDDALISCDGGKYIDYNSLKYNIGDMQNSLTVHNFTDDISNSWLESRSDSYIDLTTKDESLHILQQIQELKTNWNGYQAEPISAEVITISRNIVMSLTKQPEIYPTGRGTVQMQYELPDRSYLEFEIYLERINVLEVPGRIYDNAVEYSIGIDKLYKVNEIVNEFYSSGRRYKSVR